MKRYFFLKENKDTRRVVKIGDVINKPKMKKSRRAKRDTFFFFGGVFSMNSCIYSHIILIHFYILLYFDLFYRQEIFNFRKYKIEC